MPPGKKTKNTLACVFTVANVLGTWERYHCPLLIFRFTLSKSEPVDFIGVDHRSLCLSVQTFLIVPAEQ